MLALHIAHLPHAWSDHCDFLMCLCLQCAALPLFEAQYLKCGPHDKSGAVAISAVELCDSSFENNKSIRLMLLHSLWFCTMSE